MRVLCRPAFKINSRRARLHGRGFNNGCCCRRTGPHQWRVSGFFSGAFLFSPRTCRRKSDCDDPRPASSALAAVPRQVFSFSVCFSIFCFACRVRSGRRRRARRSPTDIIVEPFFHSGFCPSSRFPSFPHSLRRLSPFAALSLSFFSSFHLGVSIRQGKIGCGRASRPFA